MSTEKSHRNLVEVIDKTISYVQMIRGFAARDPNAARNQLFKELVEENFGTEIYDKMKSNYAKIIEGGNNV